MNFHRNLMLTVYSGTVQGQDFLGMPRESYGKWENMVREAVFPK